MIEIKLHKKFGDFAENKDVARDIRIKEIIPGLKEHEQVVLNFKGITAATQSCIHALISDVIRKEGIDILDRIFFRSCDTTVKRIINIVIDYMQDQESYEYK